MSEQHQPQIGRIAHHRGSWAAYDWNGRHVGWTQDRETAIHMAETGNTNDPQAESAEGVESDLLALWNAVSARGRVLEFEDGCQAVYLIDRVFLTVRPDDDDGLIVSIMPQDILADIHWDDDHYGCLAGVVASEPYRLC